MILLSHANGPAGPNSLEITRLCLDVRRQDPTACNRVGNVVAALEADPRGCLLVCDNASSDAHTARHEQVRPSVSKATLSAEVQFPGYDAFLLCTFFVPVSVHCTPRASCWSLHARTHVRVPNPFRLIMCIQPPRRGRPLLCRMSVTWAFLSLCSQG